MEHFSTGHWVGFAISLPIFFLYMYLVCREKDGTMAIGDLVLVLLWSVVVAGMWPIIWGLVALVVATTIICGVALLVVATLGQIIRPITQINIRLF